VGPGDVLDRRSLNRATLHRQHLLERRPQHATVVVDTIEHVVGMQAQNPLDPYYALWSRVADFDPPSLSALLLAHDAVRASLMRGTIHLVTSRDHQRLQPVFAPVIEASFNSTAWAKSAAVVEREALLAVASRLLDDQALTRSELGTRLAKTWPSVDPMSLAYAATSLLAVVQATPRGVWGQTGTARWRTASSWLNARATVEPPAPPSTIDDLVLRYIGAFGPATKADVRAWSRLTGLGEVVERLRSRLRVWRSKDGAELFDLPDAVHPEPDVPAAPRFLPEYDNVLLGHADRSRFFGEVLPPGFVGNLLVDGTYAGWWKLEGPVRARRLTVTPQIDLPRRERAAVDEEADRLLAFAGG
jgi:hypothetical protein